MKILDLTLTISDKIPVFPGSPHPHFIPWEKIKDDSYNSGTPVFEYTYRNPY